MRWRKTVDIRPLLETAKFLQEEHPEQESEITRSTGQCLSEMLQPLAARNRDYEELCEHFEEDVADDFDSLDEYLEQLYEVADRTSVWLG